MRVPAGLAVALLFCACGPKTMDARLRDAEKLADRASAALDKAEKAAIQLEPKDMENALDDAKRFLGEKDSELYPEAQMNLDRYKELSGKLPAVKAEREKRDLERRLNTARDKIVPRVQALLEAQEALSPNAPTSALVDAVESKAKAVKEAVDDELDLFVKDADFAAWAKSQRNKVDKALEVVARSKKGVAFLEGPVTTWKEGLALRAEARTKKDLGDKESALRDARTKLSACDRTAKPFDDDKITSSIAFTMPSGKAQTPAQLSITCQKDLKDTEAEWKKVLTALDAEKAKKKAQEAKEKAQAAKEEKARAAKEAKEAKERAARDAREEKARAAKDAKEAKERAARDAKEAREEKAKAAKEAAAEKARAAAEKAKAAKEAKEKAARELKEKQKKK